MTTPETIQKSLTRTIKQLVDANSGVRLKVIELISKDKSDDLRILGGVLNSAIEKASSREQEEADRAAKLAQEEQALAASLEEMISKSNAYLLSKQAGHVKNVKEYMSLMFGVNKPTRKKSRKQTKGSSNSLQEEYGDNATSSPTNLTVQAETEAEAPLPPSTSESPLESFHGNGQC